MPTPDRTSLPQIVAAARALLDSGGPAAVTMQAVAERVGVRAPSLYKRVRDRDALIVLAVEDVADELGERLREAGGSLTDLARAFRAFGHAHPEAFRALIGAEGIDPTLRRISAPVLEAATAVVGEEDALSAARFATSWVTGFVAMELAGAFRLGGSVDQAFDYGLAQLSAALRPD